MPVQPHDGGDEADRDGLAEEGGEHEGDGSQEGQRGAQLRGPVAVERGARGGRERQRRPQRRLQPAVPRRREVPQVVHAHVRRRRDAEPAKAQEPTGGRPRRRRLRPRRPRRLRHGRNRIGPAQPATPREIGVGHFTWSVGRRHRPLDLLDSWAAAAREGDCCWLASGERRAGSSRPGRPIWLGWTPVDEPMGAERQVIGPTDILLVFM